MRPLSLHYITPRHSKTGEKVLFNRCPSVFTSVRPFICVRLITPKRMKYINETSEMAKSYRGDVSQARKKTLVFELCPGHNSLPLLVLEC